MYIYIIYMYIYIYFCLYVLQPPTYPGASGSNVALNPGFTPAKWAMQNSHEQRRVTASAKDFYSKPMQSGPDDFPTEL